MLTDEELYQQEQRWLYSFEFERIDLRKTRLKRKMEPGCGHWIDGGEPYRYMVWKMNMDTAITQRYDCEFCAREDLRA